MIGHRILKAGASVITEALVRALHVPAYVKQIEWQKAVHEGTSHSVNSDYTDDEGNFSPNREQASSRADSGIKFGVGVRLEGAITHYESGDQLECVRHIILALDSVFNIIGWMEASKWCNEQNRVLYAMKKENEDV